MMSKKTIPLSRWKEKWPNSQRLLINLKIKKKFNNKWRSKKMARTSSWILIILMTKRRWLFGTISERNTKKSLTACLLPRKLLSNSYQRIRNWSKDCKANKKKKKSRERNNSRLKKSRCRTPKQRPLPALSIQMRSSLRMITKMLGSIRCMSTRMERCSPRRFKSYKLNRMKKTKNNSKWKKRRSKKTLRCNSTPKNRFK